MNVGGTETQELHTRGLARPRNLRELTEPTPWLQASGFIHHVAASEPAPVCNTATMPTRQPRRHQGKELHTLKIRLRECSASVPSPDMGLSQCPQ